jgi:hypothetical protein
MSATAAQRPVDRELQRWKTGHRIFHIYLVTMVTVADRAIRDLPTSTEQEVSRLLCDLTNLYLAGKASMRYASSFSASVYEQVVRPSMMPPSTHRGFSGLLNLDHQRMLASVENLSRALEHRFGETESRWPQSISAAWRRLVSARREAYRHHSLICMRFVDGPSLLSMSRSGIGDDNG